MPSTYETETSRAPAQARERRPNGGRPSAAPGFLLIVAFLFATWLAFSDKRDLFHLAAGLGSAIAVAGLTHSLLAIGLRRTRSGRLAIRYVFSFPWHRQVSFVPWALWKIFEANIQVAWMILNPRLPIDPRVIRIRTGLRSDVSLTALATVITLTPGTCVLDIEGDEMVVHVIHPASAASMETEMVERVRRAFEPRPGELVPASEAGAEDTWRA